MLVPALLSPMAPLPAPEPYELLETIEALGDEDISFSQGPY